MSEVKDKLSVKVGSTGLNLQSEGEASGRLANSLADLVSPLSEGMGLLGDKIRIFRQKSTIDALERAHAVAQERGSVLRPVPPKFLVTWLENASLNEEKDKELTDFWAKLLVSASDDYEASYVSYAHVLKHIGTEEAKLLQYLASDTNPEYSLDYYSFAANRGFPANISSETLQKIQVSNPTWKEALEFFEGLALQWNVQLLFLSTQERTVLPTDFYRKHDRSCAVLEREGLITVKSGCIALEETVIELGWLDLTKFGFDFVWACNGYSRKKDD